MTSQACAPSAETEAVEDSRVPFLLTQLIESRWSGLTYKLLYRHRHHRGLTSADDPMAADRAAAASVVVPPAPTSPAVDLHVGLRLTPPNTVQPVEQSEIPPTATIPRCPQCGRPMLMRRNRRNHGLFWGCVAYPRCRGTRRPRGTGDEQEQPR